MPHQFEQVKDSLDNIEHFEQVIGTPWYRDAIYERFSDAEHQRRYRLLRAKMAERGIDCVIASGSGSNWSFGAGMSWLSGLTLHEGLAQYVIVPREGEPTLICADGGATAEAIRQAAVVSDVRPSRGGRFGDVIAERLIELGLEAGRIGILEATARNTGDAMPYNHYQTLLERFPKATFEILSRLFHELLYIKGAEEIAAIEKAGAVLDLGFEAMLQAARPGATERDVMAATAEAIIAEGGEVEFVIVGATSTGAPAMPFGNIRPSGRVLQQGDVLVNELAAGAMGYTAQMGNPVCVGEPAPAVRRFWDEVVLPGWNLLASYMRPGVRLEEIQQAGRFYRERGCQGRPLVLHGMDMITAHPRIGADKIVAADFERVLKPGMTHMLEPDAITADGMLGLFVGRTFVINEGGGYSVCKTPVELFVV